MVQEARQPVQSQMTLVDLLNPETTTTTSVMKPREKKCAAGFLLLFNCWH
jgi:hypothetical protein